FGILDVPDSFVARNKVMRDSFEGKPEFRRVEYSVYSLLSFLATALFLLKYFEPKSVEIYFSEAMQSHWHDYTLGKYDELLDHRNKSINRADSNMSPFYFCQLWDEAIVPSFGNGGYLHALTKVQKIYNENHEDLETLEGYKKLLVVKAEEQHRHEAVVTQVRAKLKRLESDLVNLSEALQVAVIHEMESDKDPTYIQTVNAIRADIARIQTAIVDVSKEESLAHSIAEEVANEVTNLRTRYDKLAYELRSILVLRDRLKEKQNELANAAISRVRGD
ncbi:MAG: hypothetical protein WAO71_13085, partial [Gallionella sp.]